MRLFLCLIAKEFFASSLSRYLRVIGIAWGVLLFAIFGLWIAQGLSII